MKYVTFEINTALGPIQRIGVLREEFVIDINAIYCMYLRDVKEIYRWHELAHEIIPSDMLTFIENGNVSRDAVLTALAYYDDNKNTIDVRNNFTLQYKIEEVRLRAPIPKPVSIRDCSVFLSHLNRLPHNKEFYELFEKMPPYYRTSHTSVSGPEDFILYPDFTEKLDYELEFAVCIGKKGVNIPKEKADEYIFGYTIFNDISARDLQMKEGIFTLGFPKSKGFNTSNVIGPYLVTPDEINPNNLRMTAKLNGTLLSDGNSSDMYHKFPFIISYLSKEETLYPGELIGSGTVGSGMAIEHGVRLQRGDVIEFEIEGLGILRNTIK
jgi:2-keto-4-pentenoate hydratase/2-oxohepta-3-ene-1,7-dioic acid hydratase in catechol pathway